MGVVYRARDKKTQEIVALKRLKLKRLLIEILNRLTPYLGEAQRQRHAIEERGDPCAPAYRCESLHRWR